MYRLQGMGVALPLGAGTPAIKAACNTETFGGMFDSQCWGAYLWPDPVSTVAPPPVPTQAQLDAAAATPDGAAALVQTLANQQAVAQQALNASQVQSSTTDLILGGTAAAAGTVSDTLTAAFPWILGGVALIAVVAMGGGSPRRYGR